MKTYSRNPLNHRPLTISVRKEEKNKRTRNADDRDTFYIAFYLFYILNDFSDCAGHRRTNSSHKNVPGFAVDERAGIFPLCFPAASNALFPNVRTLNHGSPDVFLQWFFAFNRTRGESLNPDGERRNT